MQIAEQIRDFIAESFLFGPSDELRDDESFLESGILDSTGVLQLVDFLEQAYGVKVADEEVIPENLDSIAKISAYLQRKLNGNWNGGAPEAEAANAGGQL